MSEFHPFKDDAASVALAGLTVENGTDKVALYGSLDITRDAAGLDAARRLKAILDGVVKALEAGPLPKEAAVAEAPVAVANPFA